MYQKNIRSYTAQDSVGSYDWIFEEMECHEGYANMTDAEIQEWAAEIVQQSKEHDLWEAEIEGDYSEEQLAKKLAEIEYDYNEEHTAVEKAIRQWIAEESEPTPEPTPTVWEQVWDDSYKNDSLAKAKIATSTDVHAHSDGTVRLPFIGNIAGVRVVLENSLWDLPRDFKLAWQQSPRNGHLEVHVRDENDGDVIIAVGVRAMGVDWCEAAKVSRQMFNEILRSLNSD